MLWLSLFTRRRLTQLGREYAQNLGIIYTGMLIMTLCLYIIEFSIIQILCLFYLFRQLYEVAIQAAIGNKVIARET